MASDTMKGAKPMGKLIQSFLGHVLPGVIRPLHTLWNEMIGFLFVVLAIIAVPWGFRAVRGYDGSAEGFFRIVLIAVWALVMGYFGISSFLKARKISRS